jgi:hypothetical protein
MRDLSTNGTWLNRAKLEKDRQVELAVGDEIQFGNPNGGAYCFQDDTPPANILCPYDKKSFGPDNVISLGPYNLLPHDRAPEVAIYQSQGLWYSERVKAEEPNVRGLDNKDLVEFSGQQWQIHLVAHIEQTRPINRGPSALRELSLVYELSLDEESTHLLVEMSDGKLDLKTRSHHYLTLNLARYRAKDAATGIDPAEQGWVHTDQLTRDLGLDENHVNILIHRARKQLSDLLEETTDATDLVQRRSGKVRLGCPSFRIYKGSKLECAIDTPDHGQHAGP